jgi:hypothetical protein
MNIAASVSMSNFCTVSAIIFVDGSISQLLKFTGVHHMELDPFHKASSSSCRYFGWESHSWTKCANSDNTHLLFPLQYHEEPFLHMNIDCESYARHPMFTVQSRCALCVACCVQISTYLDHRFKILIIGQYVTTNCSWSHGIQLWTSKGCINNLMQQSVPSIVKNALQQPARSEHFKYYAPYARSAP